MSRARVVVWRRRAQKEAMNACVTLHKNLHANQRSEPMSIKVSQPAPLNRLIKDDHENHKIVVVNGVLATEETQFGPAQYAGATSSAPTA